MRLGLLFVHGWALDHTLWDGVLAALGEDASGAIVTDAGYYGAASSPPVSGGSWLGVGQSLGALELLAKPPPGLVGVVALDGFARFGRAADFPEGVAPRVLQRMAAQLAQGALAEFLARAGGEAPAGTPDVARLTQGLDRLAALDGRACALPVWRLHAQGDPIALTPATDASFARMNVVERRIRPALDHLSPVHDPAGCADLVRAALKALS